MKDELDVSLEIIILLVLATFMLLLGVLLLWIQTGALPYSPDATYGLFLVIVSFQVVTLGKTPFGDLRRSWALVVVGMCAAILGMMASFLPDYVSELVRVAVGIILLGGGLSLLTQLVSSDQKARFCMRAGGMVRQLTVACALVYAMSIILGATTLFPGLTTLAQTAILLIVYGASFAYLSWSLRKVRKLYLIVAPAPGQEDANPENGFSVFREASLPLPVAILILLGTLLTLLGLLLFPVNLGLLAFSADGQLGLLLTVMAIQMMALGDTPLGQFRRSWPLLFVGLVFAALGVVSSVVPGLVTGVIRVLLAFLNVVGGGISLARRYLSSSQAGTPPVSLPDDITKVIAVQTTLNGVAIAFGLSMLAPGLVPGWAVAALLVVNGLLLFRLAAILWRLE